MTQTYSIYEMLFEQDLVEVPRIIIIFTIVSILLITFLCVLSFDKIDFIILKSKLPEIIHMAQRIENIKLNLQSYLEKTTYSDAFEEEITEKTELTYNQFIFLKYIKELEELQDLWDKYSRHELINNSTIKMPYAIAYHIREILGTEFVKDNNNDENVWLYENEKLCLNKYTIFESKFQFHLEKPDHIIICMNCQKTVTTKNVHNEEPTYESKTPPLQEEKEKEVKEEVNELVNELVDELMKEEVVKEVKEVKEVVNEEITKE